jgi:hypothetical protein
MIITGMRRLVGGGVTHAVHNGTIHTAVAQITACGITFVGYDLPHESPESSLRYLFRVTDPTCGIELLRGTFEDLEVDCMSCLVRMRTWDRT